MYRAYVRKKSLGLPGKPDFKALGASYREDIREQRVDVAELRRMGQAATHRGKQEKLHGSASAFGPKGRTMRQRRLQTLRLAVAAAAQAADKDARALEIGDQVMRAEVDLATCLTLARTTLRDDAAAQRQRQAKETMVLEAWAERVGKDLVAQVKAALPSLSQQLLQPVPTPKGAFFLLHYADTGGSAAVASWAHGNNSSNLSTSLREAWASSHRTLLEEECQPCADEVPEPSPCLAAGMCLCTGQGIMLKRLNNRFKAAMKEAFPVGSERKGLLVEGSIVARIRASWVVADFDAMLDMDEPERIIFLHIGLMYLSPYRPTVMVVERVPDLPETQTTAHRLYVKALSVSSTGVSLS